MMEKRISRRSLLAGTAGALAVAATNSRQIFAASSDKVRLGIIGCGGQGEYSWSSLANEEIVSLCDVDLANVAKAAKRFPNAEVVQDFRRVIDRKDVDAVVVCTPDHWHAIPTVWALQAGKHVYCEKPLAHSIYECRVMAETARKQKRVTQMGTQIHAGSNYRRVVELVQAGAIGPIHRVDVWCEKAPSPGKLARQGTPPPSTLDYNLWLGPAPERPFDPSVVPFNWRWWWEFGGGVLADMGCHFMDLPHWALELRHPERVVSKGTTFPEADNTVPVEMRVDFHYPSRKELPPVQLTWWHGIGGPRDEAGAVLKTGFSNGVLFHGEKGQLISDYGRHKLLPEERFADYQRPAPSIPESVGHHQEWINAIKNGGPTTCNFDYSGALSETVLLGNVAFRLGREIEWDAKNLRVKNVKEKEWKPLIRREYRGDWELKR